MNAPMVAKIWHVGVVGCAGRKDEANKMTSALFMHMVAKCGEQIAKVAATENISLKQIHLVSGGAAWADHCAVVLFLTGKYGGLTLHIPCPWLDSDKSVAGGEYLEIQGGHWTDNAGWLANLLHVQMSEKLRVRTLSQIEQARKQGASLVVHKGGFHERNSAIACQCDALIAMTWSSTGKPKTGSGTMDTWNKAAKTCCSRIHLDLSKIHL